MKQMKYMNKRLKKPIILNSGFYRGYEYYILSLGTHPTAYVAVEEDNILYGRNYNEININCHGGLTYSEDHLMDFITNKWVLGWDYAHYNDFMGMYPLEQQDEFKKWTTSEIFKEVKFVVHQIMLKNRK